MILKHIKNIQRLIARTESQIHVNLDTILKMIQIVCAGFWFGSAAFFNFVAALPIFASFQDVVNNSPSDRTAYVNIVPDGTDDAKRKDLGNALAGSAVGPLFPRYFAISGVCAWLVLLTATAWRESRSGRWRVRLAVLTFALVLVSWTISQYVSELRMLRFHPDDAIATNARSRFGPWHTISLFSSALITALAGVLLAMAAWIPVSVSSGETGRDDP